MRIGHHQCLSQRTAKPKGAAVNNQWFSKVAVWLVIALVLFTVFKQFDTRCAGAAVMGYSDFLEEVRASGSRPSRSRKARAAPRSSPSPTTTSGAHHRHLPRPRPGRRPDQQRRQVRRQAARRAVAADDPARELGPDAAADRRVDLLHAPDAGRRQGRRLQLRQEQGAHARRGQQHDHLRRRRRLRRGQGRGQGVWSTS